MALVQTRPVSHTDDRDRTIDEMNEAKPSFQRISGARSSLAEAFNSQEMTGPSHATPTKQRRIARKVERWVAEHSQSDHTMWSSPGASSSHHVDPYLAYPQMKPVFRESDPCQSDDDVDSFVIVEDDNDDVFACTRRQRDQPLNTLRSERPTSSIWGSTLPRLKSRLSMTFQLPATFRGGPASQYVPSSSNDMIAESSVVTTSSRLPSLDPPHDSSTARFMSWIPSGSLSSSSKDAALPFQIGTPRTTRPSILGYFSSASSTSSEIISPTTSSSAPRSSLGSSSSYITTTSATSELLTPTDDSPDLRNLFASFRTSSIRQPGHYTSMHGESSIAAPPIGQPICYQRRQEKEPPNPVPESYIPLESSRSFFRAMPSVFMLPNDKKKKLVVAGIRAGDISRERGLQAWCAAQGEVSRLVRMKNGDIHVHYKNMEVAEEVCCICGPVVMPGVGKVTLSWFRGRSPA